MSDAREVIARALDGFIHREIAIEAATGRVLAALEAEGKVVMDKADLEILLDSFRYVEAGRFPSIDRLRETTGAKP